MFYLMNQKQIPLEYQYSKVRPRWLCWASRREMPNKAFQPTARTPLLTLALG